MSAEASELSLTVRLVLFCVVTAIFLRVMSPPSLSVLYLMLAKVSLSNSNFMTTALLLSM